MAARATTLGLLAAAGLALAAGCSAPPVRLVHTRLGQNARVLVDGLEVERDRDGVLRVPLAPGLQAIQVEEPRKPAIVEKVFVVADAPGRVEDRYLDATTANTAIVRTGEAGALTSAPEPQNVVPDPLELLADPQGPFFAPPEGEGLILISSDAAALATVGARRVDLEPRASRFKVAFVELGGAQVPVPAGMREAQPSLPAVVRLEAGGTYPIRVERRGFQPFQTSLTVRPREYTLLSVRLAEERAGSLDGPGSSAAGAPAGSKAATEPAR
jgi:hypothetical protein